MTVETERREKMSFSIEILKKSSGGFRCALFDFDGTVSLIREGWQEVMIPYFCEVLSEAANNESADAVYMEVKEFVDRLTGKQTIYQCMALADSVRRRNKTPLSSGDYKAEYLRRLELKTADRKQALQTGAAAAADFSVSGALSFVRELRKRSVRCFLASGTDEPDVKKEAKLLGIADAFDGGIYGAKDALTDCSKESVIKRLLNEEAIEPQSLLGFGDGFVEIQLIHDVGGYAVGVAADEKRGTGIDENKRTRLIDAGAGMIIPDFSDNGAILAALGI